MIALIADIHGNYPALEAVLAEIDKISPEKIFMLGDTAGYYSMINECIDVLMRNNVVMLMGNHDNYLVNDIRCERSEVVNNTILFQKKIIKHENLEWLRKSALNIIMDDMNMLHGGWCDPLDEYIDDPEKYDFRFLAGKYFFSAHTHIQCVRLLGENIYCNPGSVGQPRDGDPRAAFALFDNGKIYLERVHYDIDFIARHMEKSGFDSYFYNNLYTGSKINSNSFFNKKSTD